MKRSPQVLRIIYLLYQQVCVYYSRLVTAYNAVVMRRSIEFCQSRVTSLLALLSGFIVILFAGSAWAVDVNVTGLSAQDMLVHFATQVPNLMRFVTAFAYVFGMYLIIHGVIRMKHFGEMRTMMSHEHSMMGPIIMLTVGALLLYLPTSVQVGVSTFWAEPNPYGYVQQSNQWQEFINICYTIIQLVGTIAFIRGLIILSHIGRGGGQHGTLAKGMTHIVGGILCINIYQFVQVMANTFGLSISS